VTHIVTVIERMELFPSVPRAALPRPGHLLHERPAAKSTSAREEQATLAQAAAKWPVLFTIRSADELELHAGSRQWRLARREQAGMSSPDQPPEAGATAGAC
jgi:hypothetical protein